MMYSNIGLNSRETIPLIDLKKLSRDLFVLRIFLLSQISIFSSVRSARPFVSNWLGYSRN